MPSYTEDIRHGSTRRSSSRLTEQAVNRRAPQPAESVKERGSTRGISDHISEDNPDDNERSQVDKLVSHYLPLMKNQ